MLFRTAKRVTPTGAAIRSRHFNCDMLIYVVAVIEGKGSCSSRTIIPAHITIVISADWEGRCNFFTFIEYFQFIRYILHVVG